MKRFLPLLTLSYALLISACSTTGSVPLKVHTINSLAQVEPGHGEFQGLEFLANIKPNELKARVNIFYLHGIGWTENPDGEQVAEDFLSGIAKAYGHDVQGQIIKSSCGKADQKTGSETSADNAIYITAPQPKTYETGLAGSTLTLDRLACMDKQVLVVDEALEFVVYRVFWDDIFWNTLQFPHVGQDDAQGSSLAFAKLRRKYNRRLKDELVNYGFSDAVMYLGPAGEDIRNAVEGAMCSAALDAAGFDFTRQTESAPQTDSIKTRSVSAQTICRLASNTSTVSNQFAFVTESLGSKVIYDVLRANMTDGRDSIIDDIISGSETYMLANQVALLSLSDLNVSKQTRPPMPTKKRPKIIAMSELNDFLTYELIPFYKQLYKNTKRKMSADSNPDTPAARASMVEALGFDMVDMRLEFADKIIPILKGFVDPLQAHGGHSAEPELMLHMLCGARDGKLNREGCLATELAKAKSKKKKR